MLELLEVLEVMRRVLLCVMEAVECELCFAGGIEGAGDSEGAGGSEDAGGGGGDALCATLYAGGDEDGTGGGGGDALCARYFVR